MAFEILVALQPCISTTTKPLNATWLYNDSHHGIDRQQGDLTAGLVLWLEGMAVNLVSENAVLIPITPKVLKCE